LFTTNCVPNSDCNGGPWFFVVVTIVGLAVSFFFLISSSKPQVSFFDGALQVLSLYFQLCELPLIRLVSYAHVLVSNSCMQWVCLLGRTHPSLQQHSLISMQL